MGLPGARRLMDRLIVESALGRGTVVEMWKWVPDPCVTTVASGRSSGQARVARCRASTSPATGDRGRHRRRSRSVRRDGRPRPRSGCRRPPRCAPSTRSSAAAAERLEVLIQLCHRVLGGTRGVAMTLARVDFAANTLTWTGRRQRHRRPGRQVCDRRPHPIQCAPRRRHRRLPHTGNQAGAGDFIRAGDLIVMSHRRNRRRSPGPHRLRRVRRGDRRRTSWVSTPRKPTTRMVLAARHRGAST